jgi:hypothetical protein
VHGKKLELEHFLNVRGVDSCLLSETFLNPDRAIRLASYVCHRTERPTAGVDTAILVRRGIVHHSVPVPCLTHLEVTAIQNMQAGKLLYPLRRTFSPAAHSSELNWTLVLVAGCLYC